MGKIIQKLKSLKKKTIFTSALAVVVLSGAVFLSYKTGLLKFKADTVNSDGIVNQASLTFTNSKNEVKTVLSNTVTVLNSTPFEGRVTQKDGSPFRNIEVSPCRWTNNNFSGVCIPRGPFYTNDNGYYYINDSLGEIAEGAWTLSFGEPKLAGFPLLHSPNYHNQYFIKGQSYTYDTVIREVPLVDGKTFYDGWLRGDKQDGWLEGTTCSLSNDTSTITKTTDVDGNFRIYAEDMTAANAAYGKYTISCQKTGYAQQMPTGATEQKVYLIENGKTSVTVNMDDVITNPGTFTPTVYDKASVDQTANAQFTMLYKATGHLYNGLVTTGLPAGTYTVTATINDSRYVPTVQDIEIVAGQTTNATINLDLTPGTVAYKINADTSTVSPVFPFILTFRDSNGNILETVTKTAPLDSPLVILNYKISANNTFQQYTTSVSSPHYLDGGASAPYNYYCTVQSQCSGKPLRYYIFESVTLFDSATISGKVYNEIGVPLNGATVKATYSTWSDQFITGNMPGNDGYFELNHNIRRGKIYTITVTAPGYQTQTGTVNTGGETNNLIFNMAK